MTTPKAKLAGLALIAALVVCLLVAVAATTQAEAPKSRTLWEAANVMVGEAAYEKGDYVKAGHYFRIAAEKNNAWSPTAQFNLGVMYTNGRGVPQDYAEAMKWYRKAAAQGGVSATYHISISL